MALIEAVNDKEEGPQTAILDALRSLGQSKPALVLSSCESFLLRHKRLPLPHRVLLLGGMETVVADTIDQIAPELALRLCRLVA